MKKSNIFSIALLALFGLSSCEKFLSQRDTSYVSNIYSLADMQALMDAGNRINLGSYCSLIEMATDDFFLGSGGFDRASDLHRAMYAWDSQYIYATAAEENTNWTAPFHVIAIANTVLDELPMVEASGGLDRNHIEGTALFHRAFTYHNLVQVYCKAYDPLTASTDLGLPMRLSSDVNLPSVRATLEETYGIIERDIIRAIGLLPMSSEHKTRPDRAAAHALLARVYLLMERYPEALEQARMALDINSDLVDFNHLNASLALPMAKINEEIIFYAYTSVPILLPSRECYVDTILFDSYSVHDLRKKIFFQKENNGYHSFRGSYAGVGASGVFVGLSVSELLLIEAEALARMGRVAEALTSLNDLIKTRYTKEGFSPVVAADADELLLIVLEERRKELVVRGARWSDLKRLNRDPRFSKTLVRKIPNRDVIYQLPPNDLRYVYLIPQGVIDRSKIVQNPR